MIIVHLVGADSVNENVLCINSIKTKQMIIVID